MPDLLIPLTSLQSTISMEDLKTQMYKRISGNSIKKMKKWADISHIVTLFEGEQHRGNLFLGSISVLKNLEGVK